MEAAFSLPSAAVLRIVDLLVPGLAKIDFMRAQQHQDVFRALALQRPKDTEAGNISYAWL